MGEAHDMRAFADNTYSEVYASHVLEHLDYVNEVTQAIQEWHRVLCPGGCLSLSVPDLETLADLFCNDPSLPYKIRFLVMRMIFGGHTDSTDYHQTGFDEEILRHYLEDADFTKICHVEALNLFRDASQI
ncbi:methyltransferase domain-containing protein [Planctomycetota bacterium]